MVLVVLMLQVGWGDDDAGGGGGGGMMVAVVLGGGMVLVLVLFVCGVLLFVLLSVKSDYTAIEKRPHQ